AKPDPVAGDSARHGRSARRRNGAQAGNPISARGTKDCAARQSLRSSNMSERLRSKIALVTAAGQGIGRAIAEAFAAEAATVIATDVQADKLAGIDARKCMKLDVRSAAAVEALAGDVRAEFGALDVLVNCAGYVHQGTVLDCSERDWDFSF